MSQRSLAVIVVGGLLAGAPVPAAGDGRVISVAGEAEVRIPPDEVILSLGIETFNEDLGDATAANDEGDEAVIAVARRHEVPDQRIRTGFLQFGPRSRNGGPEHALVGYVVLTTVAVTLRDLGRFEPDAVGRLVKLVHPTDGGVLQA